MGSFTANHDFRSSLGYERRLPVDGGGGWRRVPAAVEEIAFQMENDEVSGKITVDGGFYFIKCLNKYNQELTEANKANIVDKREKEAFDDEYNGFVSSLSSNINEELWENLELETGSGMKTDTFFEVFNTYCGDM